MAEIVKYVFKKGHGCKTSKSPEGHESQSVKVSPTSVCHHVYVSSVKAKVSPEGVTQ